MKAKEIYATVSDSMDGEDFAATAGWFDRVLSHNNFSVIRRKTAAQKDARYFNEKLVNFVTLMTLMIEKKKIEEKNIIAMDETVVV